MPTAGIRRATIDPQETPGFLSSSHSLSCSGPNTSDAGTVYISDRGITLAENIRVRGASLTEISRVIPDTGTDKISAPSGHRDHTLLAAQTNMPSWLN
jgi:hypothetical protein